MGFRPVSLGRLPAMNADDRPSEGGKRAYPSDGLLGGFLLAWGKGLAAWQALAGVEAPSHLAIRQDPEMLRALGEAYLITLEGSMRCWSSMAEVFLRFQAGLSRAGSATGRSAVSPSEYRVAADEIRAFLRALGDAATLEARRMSYELEQVGETIAQAADRATPSPPQRERVRRHEAKA